MTSSGPYLWLERDWWGIRVGRFAVHVRDVVAHRAYFSERNQHNCRHWTVGRWRLLLRWR